MSHTKWLDDLKTGDQVIVHFTKATLIELRRMTGCVERLCGPRSLVVRLENRELVTFVDGESAVNLAALEVSSLEALHAIHEVRRHAQMVRSIHAKMRNLDFVRSLPVSQLEEIAAVIHPLTAEVL